VKKLTILLILLAFASVSLAQEGNTTLGFIEQTESSALELVYNWQVLAVGAIMVSVVIVAIAYAISIGMEMPELKAWAGTEIKQIIATAILILLIFVAIEFIDVLVIAMVNSVNPAGMECVLGENCLQKVSVTYINDYVDAAESGVKNVIKNNIKASAMVARGLGIYGTSIKVAQIGISTPFAAYYSLDVDRYHMVFEYYMGILSSLYSQKFFLTQFCFKIGPVILAIGIVARSFFFTRKLGGLLISIAAGMMFFFPGMYLFDWMTLDMVMEGDNAIVGEEYGCPPECMLAAPLAYTDTGEKLYTVSEVYDSFDYDDDAPAEVIDAERAKAQGITNGTLVHGTNLSGITIRSCYYGEAAGETGYDCPRACREMPYPNSVPECSAEENQTLCAQLDERCKVVRYVPGGTARPEYEECPAECKVIPPLKSDCDVGRCIESRLDCRVAKRSDLDWRPSVDSHAPDPERCNEYAGDCPANLTAEESCTWVIPDTGPCDELCAGCPDFCRIEGGSEDLLSSGCIDEETDEVYEGCEICPSTCKINIAQLEALDPQAPNCTACPAEKRLLGTGLPDDLITGGCGLDSCPEDYRMHAPRTSCEACLFTPESYTYDPPINTNCGDMCKPEDNQPTTSSEEYLSIGDGMVGYPEIKNVSKLFIPAYFLPLFNILATLVFIKTLSAMIGGDIDIPGISKLF